MSICAKFQLPSLFRSGLKVCGSGLGWCGFQVSTVSNLNPSCIELDLGLGFGNILGGQVVGGGWLIPTCMFPGKLG